MSALIHFMNLMAGRVLRLGLGLALIYVGLVPLGGTLGVVVAIIGLVPVAMGIWGHCLLELVAPQAKHA